MQMPTRPESGKPIPASWGIQLLDYLRCITPRSSASIRVSRGPGGSTFEQRGQPGGGGSDFPWEDVAFGRSPLWRDSENENAWMVTIYPGAIRFHGIGVRQMTEEADVALLAETCTVYVQATLANADAPVVLVSAVAPESSNTHVRVPLYTYVYDPAKETYAKPINHNFGDVHFGAPML